MLCVDIIIFFNTLIGIDAMEHLSSFFQYEVCALGDLTNYLGLDIKYLDFIPVLPDLPTKNYSHMPKFVRDSQGLRQRDGNKDMCGLQQNSSEADKVGNSQQVLSPTLTLA